MEAERRGVHGARSRDGSTAGGTIIGPGRVSGGEKKKNRPRSTASVIKNDPSRGFCLGCYLRRGLSMKAYKSRIQTVLLGQREEKPLHKYSVYRI